MSFPGFSASLAWSSLAKCWGGSGPLHFASLASGQNPVFLALQGRGLRLGNSTASATLLSLRFVASCCSSAFATGQQWLSFGFRPLFLARAAFAPCSLAVSLCLSVWTLGLTHP